MSTTSPETAPLCSVISLENLLLDYPEGAVILRSQDSYEFRVPKRFIIHSSPILREEIPSSPNPQPDASLNFAESDDKGSTGMANAHQVVQLPVIGTILFSLLTYIFPVPPILPSTIEHIMELLSVAQMYKMDVVLTYIRDHIAQQKPPLIRKETAFSVYALAQKHGLRTEALQAARCTLSFSTMIIQDLAEDDKLGLMPGAFLHELWAYHQRVRSNLTSDIEEYKASELDGIGIFEDMSCQSLADLEIPIWLDNYVSDLGKASVPASLNYSNFHMDFVEHSLGGHSKLGKGCKSCSDISPEDLSDIWENLTDVVHASIAKVSFTHIAALVYGPEHSVQSESDFVLGIEGTSSENGVQAIPSKEAPPFLPKYSDMPNADIILQSSDLVNFRVHRSVLVTSSPVFRDMFSLPQPSNDEALDGLPVVRLSETAEVLNSLISMLYPVPPELPSSDGILALLATTEKYDMAAVQSSIRAEVRCKDLLSPTDPSGVFQMYAVAYSKRLIPEMETAARLTLDYPLTFESVGKTLRSFDGEALRDLADFRLRCARKLGSRMKSFLDSQNGPSKIWAGCPSIKCRCIPPHLPSWLNDLFNHNPQSGCELAETVPRSVEFRDHFFGALREHINKIDCNFCSKVSILKGEAYCAEMGDMLELARNVPTLILTDVPGV